MIHFGGFETIYHLELEIFIELERSSSLNGTDELISIHIYGASALRNEDHTQTYTHKPTTATHLQPQPHPKFTRERPKLTTKTAIKTPAPT
jgi:hypothetical protein